MLRPLYPPGHADHAEGDLAVGVNVGRDNGGIDGAVSGFIVSKPDHGRVPGR
jgi:hypothetical protein